MNNKEKEAQILAHLNGIDAVANTMQNIGLANEFKRLDENYRQFVLNPGPAWENPPTTEPPAPPLPTPVPWGMNEALYTGDVLRQAKAFNMLYRDYSEAHAMSYLAHDPQPIVTLSNQWRTEHPSPQATYMLQQYIVGDVGFKYAQTSADGSIFYPEPNEASAIRLW